MIPKAHMAQVHLAAVEVHTDIMPLEGGAEPVAAFRLHKPVFPLPVTAQLPTVVTARKVKTPTTAQTALRTDIYSGGGVIKKIRLYLNVLTAQVSADEQQVLTLLNPEYYQVHFLFFLLQKKLFKKVITISFMLKSNRNFHNILPFIWKYF